MITPIESVKVSQPMEYVDSVEKFRSIPPLQVNPLQFLKTAEKTSDQPKVRFIVIRHAETPTNVEGGLPGSRTSQDRLTEMGRMQAEEKGRELVETGMVFDGYYRSPTPRTEETLEILERALQVKTPVIIDERLHEKYHGKYERYQGLSSEEKIHLKKAYLETKEKEEKHNMGPNKPFTEKFAYSADPQEIETLSHIFSRLSSFFEEKFKHGIKSDPHRIKNYLVVSHYALLKVLLMYDAFLRGYDLDYRSHDVKNLGIVIVELDSQGMKVVAADGFTFRKPQLIKP